MKPDLSEKQLPNAELTTKSVVLQLARPNINQESGTNEKHRVDHNQQLTRTLIDDRYPLFWVRTNITAALFVVAFLHDCSLKTLL